MTNKTNQYKYNIMTFQPAVIIESYKKKQDSNNNADTNNYTLTYHITLDEEEENHPSALISIHLYPENALFAQIRFCLEEKKQFQNNENNLMHQIIYMDFSKIFSTEKLITTEELKKRVKNNLSKNETLNPCTDIRLYYLFQNGVKITFSNKETITFVPFDKSGSMSRDGKIAFVHKKILDELNNRLLLGMKFEGNSTILSKYYAYRGLYLSAGTRIEETEALKFNAETVIVVADAFKKPSAKKQQIYKKLDKETGELKMNNNKNLNLSVIPFDGEGLICPEYADLINKQLFSEHEKTKATSFQIRMPFIKGILHQVDFLRFYEKEFGFAQDTEHEEVWYITDCFGVRRDLRKAKIILTKSMLKNFKWLKDEKFLNPEQKPGLRNMEFYFSAFKEHKHALYIANTDVELAASQEYVKLNYQFLNTIVPDQETMELLVIDHIKYWKDLKNNPFALRNILLGKEEDSESRTDSLDFPCETWKDALKKNLSFLSEPIVQNRINNMEASHKKKIFLGQLQTPGALRFLSGDLLALLVYIFSDCKTEIPLNDDIKNQIKEKREALEEYYIYPNSFYAYFKRMPKIQKDGKEYSFPQIGEYYPVLRNPHLSKNEHTLLRCHRSKKLNEYFKHLTGVLMTGIESTAPMAMAGADFDGDLVKIFFGDTICKAVQKTAFEEKEKTCNNDTKTKKIIYTRKYPIIHIDSPDGNSEPIPKTISYYSVKDVFGNQTGEISNVALKLGELLYYNDFNDEDKKEIQNHAADCTAVTGLEIDAAKNGLHPTGSIKILKSTLNKYLKQYNEKNDYKKEDTFYDMNYFLNINKIIDSKGSLYPVEIDTTRTKNHLKLRQLLSLLLDIIEYDFSDESGSDSDFENCIDFAKQLADLIGNIKIKTKNNTDKKATNTSTTKEDNFIKLFLCYTFKAETENICQLLKNAVNKREQREAEALISIFKNIQEKFYSDETKNSETKWKELAQDDSELSKLNLQELAKALNLSYESLASILSSYTRKYYELFFLNRSDCIQIFEPAEDRNMVPIEFLPYYGFKYMFLSSGNEEKYLNDEQLECLDIMYGIALEHGDCDLSNITVNDILGKFSPDTDSVDNDECKRKIENIIQFFRDDSTIFYISENLNEIQLKRKLLEYLKSPKEELHFTTNELLDIKDTAEKEDEKIVSLIKNLLKNYKLENQQIAHKYHKGLWTILIHKKGHQTNRMDFTLDSDKYSSDELDSISKLDSIAEKIAELFKQDRLQKHLQEKNIKEIDIIKATIKAMVDAYNDIMRLDKIIRQQQSFDTRNHPKAYGYAITILKMQYDDINSEINGQVPILAFRTIYDKLKQFLSYQEIKEVLKRLTEYNNTQQENNMPWHFTNYENRFIILRKILGDYNTNIPVGNKSTGIEKIPDSELKLLCNFNTKGYFLLYYLLEALKAESRSELSSNDFNAETYVNYNYQPPTPKDSSQPTPEECLDIYKAEAYKEYYHTFYEEYKKSEESRASQQAKKATLLNALKKTVLQDLSGSGKILNPNIYKYIRNTSNTLFWSIFSREELKNIINDDIFHAADQ